MAPESASERTLLKAIGTYLRATPAVELPAGLRRFREFRPQALWPHRAKIVGALDDEVLKARITDWLDDSKTKLPKAEAAALRAALEGRALPAPPPKAKAKAKASPAKDKTATLERVKGDLRKARDEAKKVRERAQKEVDAARAGVRKADEQANAARSALAEMDRRLKTMQRAIDKAESDKERAERRARKDLDKVVAERDEARRALREERRLRRDSEREIQRLKAAARTKPVRKQTATTAAARRKPLRAPKGLLAEDPKTLDAWLKEPGVKLLIDGYNVTKAERGFGDVSLDKQRDRMVQLANRLARKYKVETIVVFDGKPVAGGVARRGKDAAKVEFSKGEIADDHLVARLEAFPPVPVVVVTNDRELQARTRSRGATIARSDQLLGLAR